MNTIENSAKKLSNAFDKVIRNDINLGKSTCAYSFLNFKATKSEYIRKNFLAAVRDLKNELDNLDPSPEAMELKSLICGIKGNDIKMVGLN